jgi:hypothetical protein
MRIKMEDKENKKMLNMLGARYVGDERNPEGIKPNDYVVFKKWGKERIGLIQSLGEEFGLVQELTPEEMWSTAMLAAASPSVSTPTYEEFSEPSTVPAPIADLPKEHTLGRAAMWNPYKYMLEKHRQHTGKLIAVVKTKTGHYEKVYLADCRPID